MGKNSSLAERKGSDGKYRIERLSSTLNNDRFSGGKVRHAEENPSGGESMYG